MILNDFCYQPLNEHKHSFRLLRLLPSHEDKSDKIKCEMFHASIAGHSSITYEALSYAWGSTDLVDCIEVNGQYLDVTENVFSALSRLRYREEDRILWVDAICTNQTDDIEKTQQVQQMDKIFSFARTVIFWLGKPTREATLLINSLRGASNGAKADCRFRRSGLGEGEIKDSARA